MYDRRECPSIKILWYVTEVPKPKTAEVSQNNQKRILGNVTMSKSNEKFGQKATGKKGEA